MITTDKYKEIVADLKSQIKENAVNTKLNKVAYKDVERAQTKSYTAFWNEDIKYNELQKSCREVYQTYKDKNIGKVLGEESTTALHILYNRIRGNGGCRPEHTKNDQEYLRTALNGTMSYDMWKKYLLDKYGVECREMFYHSSPASPQPNYEEVGIELMDDNGEKDE
jgi:hypothetical protein